MDVLKGGGVKVLRRLKLDADLKEIPVIIVTAEDSKSTDIVICFERGAIDFL